MIGIYRIINKINGHSYIGMSVNVEKRILEHFSRAISDAPSKKEDEKRKPLYLAIRKYGKENFETEILEECLEHELKEREIYWIKKYNTYEDRAHYNLTPGGDIPGANTIHMGEDHGRAILTEKEVSFCRDKYKEGARSRDVHTELFKDKIEYDSFLKMWHGTTWKHVKPEVFESNPHKAKYSERDCTIITELYEKSNLSLNQFQKTKECYVGYGTLYKMIHTPEFYEGK